MMKSKEKSSKSHAFAKGGSGKMAPKMGVQTMTPGTAAPTSFPKAGNNPPKGGTTKMAKQSGAAPAIAGQVSTGGRMGDNSFSVKGGGKRMAPFTGATTAKPV